MADAGVQEAPAAGVRGYRHMFHKVRNVYPLPDMRLHIEFINGMEKCYNVKPLLDIWPVFKDLTQGGLFDLVKVDAGGYGISWNDYIDLACDELWENGSTIEAG